jgi:hypothetical protein
MPCRGSAETCEEMSKSVPLKAPPRPATLKKALCPSTNTDLDPKPANDFSTAPNITRAAERYCEACTVSGFPLGDIPAASNSAC